MGRQSSVLSRELLPFAISVALLALRNFLAFFRSRTSGLSRFFILLLRALFGSVLFGWVLFGGVLFGRVLFGSGCGRAGLVDNADGVDGGEDGDGVGKESHGGLTEI